MDKKHLKIIIALLVVIFIIMIIAIYYLRKKNHIADNTEINTIISQNDSLNNNNNKEDNIESGKGYEENVKVDPEETDPWSESVPITEDDLKLKQITDTYPYFLIKQCLNKFYSSKQNASNVIPSELKQYNISNFYGKIEEPTFCIDKIYKAEVNIAKDIYVVYYRVENGNGDYKNLCCIIKIDNKNLSFAIYPFEYLKSKNISNLKENDIIPRDIIKLDDIERTEYNHYRIDDISTTEIACIREIFERCSFEYEFDKKRLYTFLNEDYKKEKFPNIDDFINYLNTSNVFKGSVQKYQTGQMGGKPQYIVLGSFDNYYIVNYTNIFNYDLLLDDYTIFAQNFLEVYNSNVPSVQGKYCINRIRKALNDKNYKFVYNKLTSEQKNGTYANYNDFVNFVKQCFYSNNTFEYTDSNTISIDKYQYRVKVTDGISYRYLNMTVKLKENTDFEISITL